MLIFVGAYCGFSIVASWATIDRFDLSATVGYGGSLWHQDVQLGVGDL